MNESSKFPQSCIALYNSNAVAYQNMYLLQYSELISGKKYRCKLFSFRHQNSLPPEVTYATFNALWRVFSGYFDRGPVIVTLLSI